MREIVFRSERERVIAHLTCAGHDSFQVASMLGITDRIVRHTLSNIYANNNLINAADLAYRLGRQDERKGVHFSFKEFTREHPTVARAG